MRRSVDLNEILEQELKNGEFRLAFEEHRFYLQIAHLLSSLRRRKGLSQAELARKAGVSQPMIARLEKGDQRRTPRLETVFRLLRVLGYRMQFHVQREKQPREAA